MADPVDAAKEATSKVAGGISNTFGMMLKAPMSAKFWAATGVSLIACTAAAPVAVGATISALSPVTGFGSALGNSWAFASSAFYNGAPVIGSGIWNALPLGAEAAVDAGGEVTKKVGEVGGEQLVNNATPSYLEYDAVTPPFSNSI